MSYRQSQISLFRNCPYAAWWGTTHESTDSTWARRGSVFHEAAAAYAQHCLATDQLSDIARAEEIGKATIGKLTASEFDDFRQLWSAFISTQLFDFPRDRSIGIEEKVRLGDMAHGTPDLWTHEDGEITIIDWKSGFQIESDPDWFQLTFYAVALADRFQPRHAVLVYDYPRFNVQKTRIIDAEEIDEAREEIVALCAAMDEAFKGEPEARACSHCSMCDAFEACPAREAATAVALRNQEDAESLAAELRFLRRRAREAEEKLRAWCSVEGPVQAGDETLGFNPREKTHYEGTSDIFDVLQAAGAESPILWGELAFTKTALGRVLKTSALAGQKKEVMSQLDQYKRVEKTTRFGFSKSSGGDDEDPTT